MTETALIWAAVSSRPQDKYSIEDQLKLARDWCQQHGAVVVDELVVRGFSRDYWTLADVVAAAANTPDMTAFARLQDHIRRRDFTLFVCFDADRFGRTQSLVHEVFGRITSDVDARVYTLFDGMWIDRHNVTMIATMKAFKARTDIDRLIEFRRVGALNRANDGKSSHGKTPLFQRILRSENGREIGVVVNEDLRPLWTDLATLILRGVPFNAIEIALFEEFGHGVNGMPYRANFMRNMLLHPAFWGHATVNRRRINREARERSGAWAWDETVPPPDGLIVYRNRFPAVYSGELAEQVKAELNRRMSLSGKASHKGRVHRFSGLLVCEECHYALHRIQNRSGNVYYRCDTAVHRSRRSRARAVTCSQRGYVPVAHIQQWFTERIEARLANGISELFADLDQSEQVEKQITQDERRLERLRARTGSLIIELADAPQSLKEAFRRQLNEAAQEMERLEADITAARHKLQASDDTAYAQSAMLALIRENGIDWFWSQPDLWIHQQLSAALGMHNAVCKDGEVIGIAPLTRPAYKRRR